MDPRSFAGVKIIESDVMPPDQLAFLPSGEAVMGREKYAALMKLVGEKMNSQIENAILGVSDMLPKKPDPEAVAMQTCDMWGQF